MVQRFGNGDSPTWFIGLPAVHAQVSCQTPRSSTDAAPPHPAWAVQLPRTILLPANEVVGKVLGDLGAPVAAPQSRWHRSAGNTSAGEASSPAGGGDIGGGGAGKRR